MGVLGRRGWYLKDPAVLLDLARIDTILFDKTGTLTTSAPGIRVDGLDVARWRLVRRLAMESVHPVSRAIADGGETAALRYMAVSALREVPHAGISGLIDGHRVAIGQSWFVSGRADAGPRDAGSVTWASVDGDIGRVSIASATRPGVTSMLSTLAGRFQLWLASGDHDGSARQWHPWFGDRLRFRQTPEDKLTIVRTRQAAGHHVLVVGDGLNDAAALTTADVGLAVSDDTACVVPACHAIVRGAELVNLAVWIGYARRARRVVALCFAVSIVYNVAGLWLALAGLLTPLATAILMPVSSLTVIGLSVGLMRWRSPRAAAS
jgi:Cu+-exporting ATPase